VKLTKRQQEKLSRILEDVGKLIILTHVLGLLISPTFADLPKIILGIFLALTFFIIALIIDKEE